MIDAVVKIGGSLARGGDLGALCATLAEVGRTHGVLVVPGGGAFADVVREHDRRFQLSDSAAHWMAILAMDQYAYLLADLIPASRLVRDIEAARTTMAKGVVPVLAPFELIWSEDVLPHTWAVTSDSLAAWIATHAQASLLVLVKDGNGMSRVPEELRAAVGQRVAANELATWGLVDGYLSSMLERASYDLWIVNGELPERLAELLETGQTIGIRHRRSAP